MNTASKMFSHLFLIIAFACTPFFSWSMEKDTNIQEQKSFLITRETENDQGSLLVFHQFSDGTAKFIQTSNQNIEVTLGDNLIRIIFCKLTYKRGPRFPVTLQRNLNETLLKFAKYPMLELPLKEMKPGATYRLVMDLELGVSFYEIEPNKV